MVVDWLLLLRLLSSVDSASLRACYSGSGTGVCTTSLALRFIVTRSFPQGSSNFPAAMTTEHQALLCYGSLSIADSVTLHNRMPLKPAGAPSGCRSAEFGQQLIHPAALCKAWRLLVTGALVDRPCKKMIFLPGDLFKAL